MTSVTLALPNCALYHYPKKEKMEGKLCEYSFESFFQANKLLNFGKKELNSSSLERVKEDEERD